MIATTTLTNNLNMIEVECRTLERLAEAFAMTGNMYVADLLHHVVISIRGNAAEALTAFVNGQQEELEATRGVVGSVLKTLLEVGVRK